MYQGFDEEKAKILGKNLKTIIEKRRLSLTEIAKALDVSVSAVSNWTSGMKIPRNEKLEKLCVLLDVSKDELLGKLKEEDEQSDADYAREAIASYAKTEAEYVKEKYLKLDSYGKHTVKIVLEAEYNRCAQQRKK